MLRRLTFLVPMLAAAQAPQPTEQFEQPVGMILSATGGVVARAPGTLPLGAKGGVLLFAGETLRAETGSIRFSFCPEKSIQTLPAGGEVTFEGSAMRVRTGALADKQAAAFCSLPAAPRAPDVSKYHIASTRDARAVAAGFKSRVDALPEADRASLMKELAPVDQALAANPNDAMARAARSMILEKYKLSADAAEEARRIQESMPDATWVSTRLFVLEKKADAEGSGPPPPPAPGKTYALLVGISSFQSADIRALRYAHEDARLFERYLRSERGGSLPDENLVVLLNEQATSAAIRNSMTNFLKARATKNDTVILFFATHGTVVSAGGRRGGKGYIVTWDSNPEDLATTGLGMADVQDFISKDLTNVREVLAFIDVCHAGKIGSIPEAEHVKINAISEKLEQSENEGELFIFRASRSNETSEEGPQFGGGHGAFSFFLLEALNGKGDIDQDGNVTINELIGHTYRNVVDSTFDRQHPKDGGEFEGKRTIANTRQQGITMLAYAAVPPGATRGSGGLTLTATASGDTRSLTRRSAIPVVRTSVFQEAIDFEEAIGAGRILAAADRNALSALRQLQERQRVPREEYLAQRNRLQIMLEDNGQQVLLRYLAGEQIPQTRGDFVTGAAYFATARQLSPNSVFLEARETFCEGRAALFPDAGGKRDYRRGQELLERSIRLDPEGAYSYNALGIAYLEQAVYDKAALAFQEAIRRAPYWAYPRHNLALTNTQAGDYASAIRGYQEAMALAPSYSYLPYNLGLVYQRINRRREAEAAFRKAIDLNPKEGMPYNALGYLNASTGRAAEAEKNYQQAIALSPDLVVARHNLGALYAEKLRRPADAIAEWRRILDKNPDYLPSRLSLAKTLAATAKNSEAIAEYEIALKARPEYSAARLELARLQLAAGNRDGALANLREVARQQPANALVWEQIGDAEKAAGRAAESREAYQKALAAAVEGSVRKRIRRKM